MAGETSFFTMDGTCHALLTTGGYIGGYGTACTSWLRSDLNSDVAKYDAFRLVGFVECGGANAAVGVCVQ